MSHPQDGGPTRDEIRSQIYHRLVESISASEKRCQELVQNLREIVFRSDSEGRLSFVNQAWLQALGRSIDRTLGRRLDEFVLDPDRGRVAEVFAEALEHQGRAGAELRFRHRDGSTVHMAMSVRRQEDSGWIGSLHDVSERKRAEREWRQAKEAAESASRAKTHFLANMSHELRTPLAAILGYCDYLGADGLEAADRESLLRRVRLNAAHLLGLVNGILELSQIENGRLTLLRQPCSPRVLAEDVANQFRAQAVEKGLSLDLRCHPDTPAVIQADPIRLRQILAHLVSNAVKFTTGGGVTLTLDLMPEEPQQLRFVVSDSGPGMSPEQVRRIFQPFVQADDSSSRKHGGAGLGLSIVKGLAELMEGRVTVDTEPGRGSRFTLTLTVPESENPRGEESFAPSGGVANESVRRFARVLLAEDSRDMQRLLTRCLELAGHRVEIAEDGAIACRKALQALEQGGAFDLVLMDLQMPGMDGYAATRRLRSLNYRAPIFALTAHAVDGERGRCLEMGFDDYLCKPVTRQDLETAVRRALELHPKGAEGALPADSD